MPINTAVQFAENNAATTTEAWTVACYVPSSNLEHSICFWKCSIVSFGQRDGTLSVFRRDRDGSIVAYNLGSSLSFLPFEGESHKVYLCVHLHPPGEILLYHLHPPCD